ncbi:MAG: hypothetical protein LBB13_03595, partial [Rickettsiales bacterium]|nr:hypothetical protein [Rickettsiales bacterium]
MSDAIDNENIQEINLETENIYFENTLTINRSGLTIAGSTEGGGTTLDGVNCQGNRFFSFGDNIDNVELNNLTFKNANSNDAGAVFHFGEGNSNIILKNVTFDNNTAAANGGVIFSSTSAEEEENNNNIIFQEEIVFKNNASELENVNFNGGAIYAEGTTMTFDGRTTFEGNTANRGAALFLAAGSTADFNSGINLLDNRTTAADSGAIHLEGDENRQAIVSVTQNDFANPTKLGGEGLSHNINTEGDINTGGNNVKNAIYLKSHSQLNFNLLSGNVDLYDVIRGDSPSDNNNNEMQSDNNNNEMKLEGQGGWFNVNQGGSIDGLTLTNNGGRLNLAADDVKLSLKNFTNSGHIKFCISPGGSCSKIEAEGLITLAQGTNIEIVPAPGIYNGEISHNIIESLGEAIDHNEVDPAFTMPYGMTVTRGFSEDGKSYQLTLEGEYSESPGTSGENSGEAESTDNGNNSDASGN